MKWTTHVMVWTGSGGSRVMFFPNGHKRYYPNPSEASIARLADLLKRLGWTFRPWSGGTVGWHAFRDWSGG